MKSLTTNAGKEEKRLAEIDQKLSELRDELEDTEEKDEHKRINLEISQLEEEKKELEKLIEALIEVEEIATAEEKPKEEKPIKTEEKPTKTEEKPKAEEKPKPKIPRPQIPMKKKITAPPQTVLKKPEVEKVTETAEQLPDYDDINRHSWEPPYEGTYQGTDNNKPLTWILPNNQNFPNFINRHFDQFRAQAPTLKSEIKKAETKSTENSIFPHQEIVKNFLKPESPYRGLLAYHGLGSGKTRTSIETALPFWKLGWNIIFLAPGALKDNFISELQRWSNQQGVTAFDNISYKEFRKPEVQRELRTYLITYNHYTLPRNLGLVKDRPGLINFDETGKNLIIIDEVHDLISTLTKPTNVNAQIIYQTLMKVKNSKILALTGTPIVNKPFELALLFNILRGPICRDPQCSKLSAETPHDGLPLFPANEEEFNEFYLSATTGKVNSRKAAHFKTRIMGLVSYYRGRAGPGIYPEVVDHGIVRVELSPEVWKEYKTIRLAEIQKEEEAKKKRQKYLQRLRIQYGKTTKTEDVPVGNTFRVDSRLVSNFLLPAALGLHRPIKAEVERTMEKAELERELNYQPPRDKKPDPEDLLTDEFDQLDLEIEEHAGSGRKPKSPTKKTKPKADEETEDELLAGIEELTKTQRDKVYQNRIRRLLDEVDRKPELFEPENLAKYSPKYLKALQIMGVIGDPDFGEKLTDRHQYYNNQRLPMAKLSQEEQESKEHRNGGLVFVYSNFLTLEGLRLFAKALKAYGYKPARIGPETKIEDLEPGVLRYAVISGDEDTSIRSQTIDKIFNDPRNQHGQYLKVLLGTSAAAKGINLKRLRQNIHLDPHWNEGRPDQVKGRGRRMKSHVDLPEEEQNLHIHRLFSVLTDNQQQVWKDVRLDKEAFSTDETIYKIAKDKEIVNKQFEDFCRESAIDCELNQAHNNYRQPEEAERPAIDCLSFGMNPPSPPQAYSYLPDYREQPARLVVTRKAVTTVEAEPYTLTSAQQKRLKDNPKTLKLYQTLYDAEGKPKLARKLDDKTFKVRVKGKPGDIPQATPLYDRDGNIQAWILGNPQSPKAQIARAPLVTVIES